MPACAGVTLGVIMQDDRSSGEDGVVALGHERQMRASQSLLRIERYWGDVRGNRLVPSRAEIDPRGLAGSLSQAFVLERIAKGLARFRIAGSHVSDLMGLEVRGMPLSTVFLPEARLTLADALEAAFDDPSIIRFQLSAETGFGRPALTGHMVLLPLRSDLGEISRILGGIEMDGDLGRAPRRLRIEDQSRQGLTGVGAPEVRLNAFQEPPRPQPSTLPSQSGQQSAPKAHSHLTLVVDNVS